MNGYLLTRPEHRRSHLVGLILRNFLNLALGKKRIICVILALNALNARERGKNKYCILNMCAIDGVNGSLEGKGKANLGRCPASIDTQFLYNKTKP